MVAVDETGFRANDVLEGRNLQRIAALDHQPHLARDKADNPVLAWIEPFLAGLNAFRAQFTAWQMHAGQVAGALRERDQRMLVADIAQVDADAGLSVQQLPELRHRKAVAGVNPDDRGTLMQKRLDLGGEFLCEILELRAEASLHTLAGPDEFFTEGSEPRTLAALGFDQRHTEELRPLLDQVPDMAIGQVRIPCGAGELSGFADFIENAQHHHDALRAVFSVKSPDGLDLD